MSRHDAGLQPLVDRARTIGITVEELDADHIRFLYDARIAEQHELIDDIYRATHDVAAPEGDGQYEVSPHNWFVVHFDFGNCGDRRFAPEH